MFKNFIENHKEIRTQRFIYFIKKKLDKNGIPLWLDSVTLPDIFLNRKLHLSENHIINISISSDYIKRLLLLKNDFWPWCKFQVIYDKSGFRWIEGDIVGIKITPLLKFRSSHVKIIITLKFNSGSNTRWVNGFICKQMPSEYYRNFEYINIGKFKYRIPSNAEQYLAFRFNNWREQSFTRNSDANDRAVVTDDILHTLPRKTRYTNPEKVKRTVHLTGKNLVLTKNILKNVTAILEKHGIRYWLDFGTLLGIIRQGELLPWDEDADICIHGDDLNKFNAIKRKFPLRYRMSYRYDYSNRLPGKLRVVKIKYWYKKYFRLFNIRELHLDVFIKYKIDDYYYWIGSNALKRVKAQYHDHLDTIIWDNQKFFIPSDVDNYLTDLFGDWKTPVQNYDSSLDDRAIYDYNIRK